MLDFIDFFTRTPIIELLKITYHNALSVWNYPLYITAEKQQITLANVIIGLILFFLGLRLAKYLSQLTRQKVLDIIKLDAPIKDAIEKMLHYLYIIFITLIVLDISHVPLTVFTFVGGALAISIGLGSQNILNNFISGLIIMVEQPIRIGDYIEINDMVGRVINIGARCINLRTSSNIDILVPNSVMLQNTVVNWTLNDTSIRISSIIPISNEAPSRLVEEILLQVLNQNSDILKDPKPQAFFSSFAEGNAVKFEILFWIDLAAMAERKKILSDINHALTAILRDHNISLALNWKEGDRFK